MLQHLPVVYRVEQLLNELHVFLRRQPGDVELGSNINQQVSEFNFVDRLC